MYIYTYNLGDIKILGDFFRFLHDPLPQVKWNYIIITRSCMYDLAHELTNNLRLR